MDREITPRQKPMSWVLSHRNLYIYHIVHRKFHAHIDSSSVHEDIPSVWNG